MKLFKQLLKRHIDLRANTMRVGRGHDAHIAAVIKDALASAGLLPGREQTAETLSVIEDALARTGLQGPALGRKAAELLSPTRSTLPASTRGVHQIEAEHQGLFLSETFRGPIGSLGYKLYVPAVYEGNGQKPLPLVVMLHGCTQSPDDFAAGTRMNTLAEQQGFLVAYPAQSANANGSRCWNWFRPQDQVRGQGEPALIAGMTAQLISKYRIDPSRVYVAGLSAGGAMAVVMGQTYPDVFAAVGVHSGLPYRAANDVGSAFAAMKGGAVSANTTSVTPVPTIVFHGDRDHTVAVANGDAVIVQAGAAGGAFVQSGQTSAKTSSGRDFTRTEYSDASGHVVLENWRIHGGGHAWMGGSATGTYTDPHGPDASREMLRFFLGQTMR